jgi:predicted XRE-type DNA-binding protein
MRRFEDKFFFKINFEGEGDCWIWKAATTNGYGVFHAFGESKAHRVSYRYFVGDIPEGMVVCHTCDNPLCVNPTHLFLGTQRDNMQDMISKGRHCKQKLFAEDIESIRQLYAETDLSQYKLAEMFGVSQNHICDIVNMKKWVDLPSKGEVLEVGLRLESPAIA